MQGCVINLAPTGMIPTRELNPNTPVTAKQVARDVVECVAMGVNLVHLHARDDQGKPTHDKDVYARLIGAVREQCPDVVVCVSLSGRRVSDVAQRAEVLELRGDLKPDMGSLTLSSLNFPNEASSNSPRTIRELAQRMADRGVKPELEVFDVGMLNYALYLIAKGHVQPPHYFNIILGNIASAQATPAHLGMILAGLPEDSTWCTGGIGQFQLAANTLGLLYGNGVRVGLEDNLWMDQDRTQAASNPRFVERIARLMEVLGKHAASPGEVRRELGLRPKSSGSAG